MRKLCIFAMTIVLLLILSACESGGKFVMHNQTSYPVWTSVDNADTLEIAAGESHTFPIDTDSQSFLTGEVKRQVKVKVFGETYSLYDDYEEGFTDSTLITIKAGKTLNAFLAPNRASVKIINNRSASIAYAEIWQHKNNYQYRVGTLSNIATGESAWQRVDYATPTNNFYYKVHVMMENGESLNYGGPGTVLAIDEQFLITINPAP
jgi:hypothetical protein